MMQIYASAASAPKQRVPNLLFGMRAMDWMQLVAFKRLSPKLGFRFTPFYWMRLLLLAYAADLNWKPLGTKPVFT